MEQFRLAFYQWGLSYFSRTRPETNGWNAPTKPLSVCSAIKLAMGMSRKSTVFVVNDAVMRFSGEVFGVDVDSNAREIRQFVQQLMPRFLLPQPEQSTEAERNRHALRLVFFLSPTP